MYADTSGEMPGSPYVLMAKWNKEACSGVIFHILWMEGIMGKETLTIYMMQL